MSGALLVAAVAAVAAGGAAAVALRRHGLAVAGWVGFLAGVAADAVAGGPSRQPWVAVPLAVAAVAAGEAVRVAVDTRAPSGRSVTDPAALRQVALAAAVAVALAGAGAAAAVTVAGTGPGAPGGGGPFGNRHLPGAWAAAALAAVAATVGAAGWALRRLGGRRSAAVRAGPLLAVAAVVVLALPAALAAGGAADLGVGSRSGPSVESPAESGPGSASDPAATVPALPGQESPGVPDRSPPWLALAVVAAALAVLLVVAARGQLVPPDDLQPDRSGGEGGPVASEDPVRSPTLTAAEVAATVDAALGHLRADLEPRLAVRCAYAAVAAGFGRTELARARSETEGEYLRRVLGGTGASAALLERLTELFMVARFSEVDIDAAMRDEALAAFEELRASLGAGTR